MAKGYWIAQVDVSDTEGYKPYAAANPAIFKNFGGCFVVRAGKHDCVEGETRSRQVVIEFPDYATALACYRSPEYQANIQVRQPHATTDLVIVEGYAGPQLTPSASAPAPASKKGYWIGYVDVTDPEGHKVYAAAMPPPLADFGARYLVRGGAREVAEGKARGNTVMIEFPSFEAAVTCYHSAPYQAALKLREGKAAADLVAAEGYDGPQP